MKTKKKLWLLVLLILFAGYGLKAQEPVEKQVYKLVEETPEFSGGMKALQEFVLQNIQYPEIAKRDSITGIVYVQFVINQIGKVSNVEIKKGVHPLLDEEALRVVKMLPAWKPGKVRGKQVDVEFILPVKFELN
ncbi:MAG: energy transducer TonB [Prolixibacteraceae bacterium]|nr:energy transducer TonB [Prolixibacteraceae bacterium]MBN2773158.1 energy transducer TonB [Prolixibacteraceae bacterium]